MGNSTYRTNINPPADPKIFFQTDLPKFVFQSKIGNGKFMKTYCMRVDGNPFVVKVYMKLNEEDLQLVASKLTSIWKTITPAKYPYLLPYECWMKSSTRIKSVTSPVYLVRQYIAANLHDRLSTRPFLHEFEKLWLVFQLFKCLEICHSYGIVHGDVKPENIMCTTWNWLVLTDFAHFKPAVIPDDDPTDFQYYFDTMGRRSCYVAPERFVHKEMGGKSSGEDQPGPQEAQRGGDGVASPGSAAGAPQQPSVTNSNSTGPSSSKYNAQLTPAMDIFSLGCTIAEIFLDGEVLLDLPAMLQYTSATRSAHSLERLDDENSPARAALMRIPNKHIREVIVEMTQRDPDKRLKIGQYRHILEGHTLRTRSGSSSSISAPMPMSSADRPATAAAQPPGTPVAPGQPAVSSSSSTSPAPPLPPMSSPNTTANYTGQPQARRKTLKETAVFPDYLDRVLHPLFLRLHWRGVTPDDRIGIICEKYGELLGAITGRPDEEGRIFFTHALVATNITLCVTHHQKVTSGDNSADNYALQTSLHDEQQASTIRAHALAVARERGASMGVTAASGLAYVRHLLAVPNTSSNSSTATALGAGAGAGSDNNSSTTSKATCAAEVPQEAAARHLTQVLAAGSIEDLMKHCRHLIADLEQDNRERDLQQLQRQSEELAARALRAARPVADMHPANPALPPNFFDLADNVKADTRFIHSGLVVIVQLVLSNFRHVRFAQTKLVSIMLLVRLGMMCCDEIILQRILPMLILAMEDPVPCVRAMAVRSIRALLSIVRAFSTIEVNLFPQCIFPALDKVAKDGDAMVRVAFAESIAIFAETSRRVLDKAHLAAQAKAWTDSSTGGNGTSNASTDEFTDEIDHTQVFIDFGYDEKLKVLHEHVSHWIRDLVLDVDRLQQGTSNGSHDKKASNNACGSIVKRALLVDIVRLCVFFGQEAIMDMLLTQLLTFLNDQDWELRYAFCSTIPSVCAFVGSTVSSECILPCVENALVDVEEKVVSCAAQCLLSLVNMGLLSKLVMIDVVKNVAALLLHPSDTIRMVSVQLTCAVASSLGNTDATVFIVPHIQPMLKFQLTAGVGITEKTLSTALRSPLCRRTYRKALQDRQMQSTSQGQHADFVPMASAIQVVAADGSESASSTAFSMDGTMILVHNNLKDSNEAFVSSASSKTSVIPSIVVEESTSQGAEEMEKLQLMKKYLDAAAREMITKTMQWRNGLASATGGTGQATGAYRRGNNDRPDRAAIISVAANSATRYSGLDSLLSVSGASMPEHSLQSLIVPHQKHGVWHYMYQGRGPEHGSGPMFQPVPEDLRNLAIDNLDGIKSSTRLRAIFGLNSGSSLTFSNIGNEGNIPKGQLNDVLSELGVGQPGSVLSPSQALHITMNGGGTGNNDVLGNQGMMMSAGGSTPLAGGGGGGGGAGGMTRTAPQGPTSNAAKMIKTLNSSIDFHMLVKRIKALKIPPLPPDVGSLVQPDDRKYNCYSESLDTSAANDSQNRSFWQPKASVLVSSLLEHSLAVNRLAVSPDQTFLVSASSDKTARVWQLRGLHTAAFPRSVLTYNKHKGAVLDVTAIENSHAVATSSDDGSIHVWKVDMASSGGPDTGGLTPSMGANSQADGSVMNDPSLGGRFAGLSCSGLSVVRTVDPCEGPVLSVQHFNNDVCSVLLYATQRGKVHGWDLRSTREAFQYDVRQELGHPTSMTMAPDRNWVCVGTEKGYIGLWDIRFNTVCKMWRHSAGGPIHRLACCKAGGHVSSGVNGVQNVAMAPTEGAYLFVASGANETAVWGVPEGGECLKCFRALPFARSRDVQAPLPFLRDINLPRHPMAPIVSAFEPNAYLGNSYNSKLSPSVRAIIGRISQSSSSYLVTAGTDHQIRFWDFLSPVKCFTVSGLRPAQPKPMFDMQLDGGKLFTCYDAEIPPAETILQSQLPVRECRGPVPPGNNFKDAILDLKNIDIPIRLMISCSRDGDIKLWR